MGAFYIGDFDMTRKPIILIAIFFSVLASSSVMAQRVNHLPQAPSWDYGVLGGLAAAPVGTDYCDMNNGEGCMGANVLITGPAALVIFNQLSVTSGGKLRKGRGIECVLDSDAGAVKCLFHVTGTGTHAGEMPWISD